MANEDVLSRDNERRALIHMALGKTSVAFMRQSGDVVMPTQELLEVAEDIYALWALEVDELAAALREAREENTRIISDAALLIRAFDDDLFVRNTKDDHRSDWAIKFVRPLAAMSRLQHEIDAAMKPPGGENAAK